MQVLVSGQHLSIGLSLQEYVKERITGSIKKYFDSAVAKVKGKIRQ